MGKARLRTPTAGEISFHRFGYDLALDLALGTDQPQQRLIRPFASSIGHNHGLFDEHDKSADRQISDRTDRPSPDFFFPGRDFRYRSGIQQYRGMVVVDPRRGQAPQGSAVLS